MTAADREATAARDRETTNPKEPQTMTLSDADILRAAKERISERGHFVMGALAWTRQGRMVDPLSPEAWRWNARGALNAEVGGNADRIYRYVEESAAAITKAHSMYFPSGVDLADNLGHALTLQAFDDAIAKAEAEA